MKTAEDDNKFLFTILLWLLPLDLLCQSKQRLVECDHWSLARVLMLHCIPNHIYGMLDHSYCVGALKQQRERCGATDGSS